MRTLSPALKYTICIIGTLAVGSLSGLVTANSIDTWYATLEKPPFNPPNWIFGPVWTFLYVLMGTAAGMVWNTAHDAEDVRQALFWYIMQLVLNALWSLLFFGMRSPLAALVDIFFLLATILICIRAFRSINGTAGALLYPYVAWVIFATILNAAIVALN